MHTHAGTTAYKAKKQREQKKSVPCFYVGMKCDQFGVCKSLALVNMKEEILLLFCQRAPSCKTLLAIFHLLRTDVFSDRGNIDSN